MARVRRSRASTPRKLSAADQRASDLRTAKHEMLTLSRYKRFFFDLDKFLLIYWTPGTLAEVNHVRSIIDPWQIDRQQKSLPDTVAIDHPVYPAQSIMRVNLTLEQPSNAKPNVLWPHDLSHPRDDADPAVMAEMEAVVKELYQDALDRAIFDDVCDFLIDHCTDKAARYLFPPYLALLRWAGYTDTASDLETIDRVTKLPPLPYLMRQKIRHCIQWFAIQEMLGVWEGKDKAAAPANGIEVTLEGNHTLVEAFEGQEYEVKLKS